MASSNKNLYIMREQKGKKGNWSNFKQGLSRRTEDEEQVGGNREQVEK